MQLLALGLVRWCSRRTEPFRCRVTAASDTAPQLVRRPRCLLGSPPCVEAAEIQAHASAFFHGIHTEDAKERRVLGNICKAHGPKELPPLPKVEVRSVPTRPIRHSREGTGRGESAEGHRGSAAGLEALTIHQGRVVPLLQQDGEGGPPGWLGLELSGLWRRTPRWNMQASVRNAVERRAACKRKSLVATRSIHHVSAYSTANNEHTSQE